MLNTGRQALQCLLTLTLQQPGCGAKGFARYCFIYFPVLMVEKHRNRTWQPTRDLLLLGLWSRLKESGSQNGRHWIQLFKVNLKSWLLLERNDQLGEREDTQSEMHLLYTSVERSWYRLCGVSQNFGPLKILVWVTKICGEMVLSGPNFSKIVVHPWRIGSPPF